MVFFSLGRKCWQGVLCLLSCVTLMPVYAETLPLWDVGPGLTVLHLPDYRGAKTATNYVLPFPYIIYRGKQFRVDERKGMRGMLWNSDKLSLDISLNGSMPVNSDHTPLRQGMDNLDPVFEVGPSLEIPLYYSAAEQTHWEFNMPIRAVFSARLKHIEQQGWLLNPRLDYLKMFPDGDGLWRLNISAGPLFASDDYHNYYYGVSPAEATAQRPAYQGRSGYSGTRMYFSLSKHLDHKYRIGGFISADLLNNAVFLDSSLVERKKAIYGGIFFSWILASSSQPASDDLE